MPTNDRTLKALLFVIAVFLGIIALHPYFTPAPVKAQAVNSDLYVEPGVYMLRSPSNQRQVLGKVVIDLRSGSAWGFPTLSSDPYPSSALNSSPETSHPFLLGRFAVEDMNK